ncbi:hypothetical protein Tco_1541335 [Tanacetum coccineum]
MEKLDHMVKDFHLFEYNKGMETRKWSEDDKRRSKDFITAIEKRLQIRRIFRSLESFVGGRIRDIDYRLINRTTRTVPKDRPCCLLNWSYKDHLKMEIEMEIPSSSNVMLIRNAQTRPTLVIDKAQDTVKDKRKMNQKYYLQKYKISNGLRAKELKRLKDDNKNIDDMTIVEYMEYEAEMRRDPRGYTRNSGLTTPRETMSLENMHQLDKLKTNNYFPSIPTCFEPAQLHTDDIHEPLGNKPNDYHLFTPQSHYETKEVSSDEDVDEWLNEELSKRMTGEDKEEEEDALIGILKTMGVSFVAEEEEGDSSKALLFNEINPGSFTLPCTIGNLKIYYMADVGSGINMMPKSLFEHLKLANLKKTSMAIEMVIDTLEEPDETILLGRPFLATIHAQIDVFRGEILLGVANEKESEYFNPYEIENDDSPALEQRTFHYSVESIDTVDSSSDSQENEVGSHLSENVSRWHVCKPVHITFKVCEEDCGIMRDRMTRGNGMKFDDFLSVRYGNKNIDDWYDEGFEEDELWENGIEEIDYTPLLAKNENFEVHCLLYKKVEFEVPLTCIHVVVRFCLGVTT